MRSFFYLYSVHAEVFHKLIFHNFNFRSATVATEQQNTAFPPGTFGSKLEHYETNYYDYLAEAKSQLESCAKACQRWVFPYDGQNPSMDALVDNGSESESMQISSVTETGLCNSGANSRMLEDMNGSNEGPLRRSSEVDEVLLSDNSCQSSVPDLTYLLTSYDSNSFMSSPEKIEDFIHYLDEVPTPPDLEKTFEESVNSLDSILSSLCSRTDSSSVKSSNNTSVNLELSPQSIADDSTKAVGDGTTFEVINSTRDGVESDPSKGSPSQDTTSSFVEISMSNFASDVNVQTALSTLPQRVSLNSVDTVVHRKPSRDESTVRSVSFNLTDASMQNTTSVPAAVSNTGKLAPNIGNSDI